MIDVSVATLKETIQDNIEGLFKLVGVSVLEAPTSTPSRSFQVPVTSLDISETHQATLEAQAKVNDAVNRAFQEVMGILRFGDPPKAIRTVVSVSRKNFMNHIYLTIETYDV